MTAYAYAAATQAGLYPEVDAGGRLSYNKQSNNRRLRSGSHSTYYGDNQIAAQVASYEIDFWERVRDLVKAANAVALASADSLAQAKLELHAELASAYS
ncbi:MAG: TolC family protein [Bradyrhizobium sp.]|uniref:TolC family protein n=1 Tax=Bradyrhizobium sp. TaxID=376 RepID=UPI001C29392D|nr:TolC family protein [Bradyrhizobium sp.]MBU6463264.1 TolC family protein [Pseudomonadota bacterium]MDE2066623.1 TolC family protein [Bradyrhizobium sp.]MDE2467992.1 TolC family protein [Bradyrhizobium sp.]